MSKFNFNKVISKVEQTKTTLPIQLGQQAQSFFLNSFTQQGFTDSTKQSWKEVQRRTPGTPAFKYPKNKGLSRQTKPILSMTGRLRRAVSNCVRMANWDRIRLVVDVPYAVFHNKGTDKLPKRKFMGDSVQLRAKQKEKIIKTMNKIWQA